MDFARTGLETMSVVFSKGIMQSVLKKAVFRFFCDCVRNLDISGDDVRPELSKFVENIEPRGMQDPIRYILYKSASFNVFNTDYEWISG